MGMDQFPSWKGRSSEAPAGGGTGFILRNGIPIVLTIVVTSLAANFFLRMRGDSGPQGSGSAVFAEPEREQPSEEAVPAGGRSLSSLDFAPRMGEPEQPPPAKEEPAPAPPAAPPAPPVIEVAAPRPAPRPKAKLVTGSLTDQNSRASSAGGAGAAGGFNSLRDQQAAAQAQGKEKEEDGEEEAGALGGGPSKKAAQKAGRAMQALVVPSDPGLVDIDAIKQQAYQLQQIGQELIQQQGEAMSAIKPSAPTRPYGEGRGPHQGR